jgi:aryl-alcohol dehydrogenase-like predicted oxidoreductase
VEHRTLGDKGPEVSVIGIGCNNFGMKLDRDASVDVIRAALDTGITHFDTAEMYGGGRSEEFLGETLGSHRDEVVIATKFSPRPKDQAWQPGLLAQRITEACEASLRRLRTDHIDLYYQHYLDPDAPIDEALSTLADLVAAGKVIHIASSNVESDRIDEAAEAASRLGTPAFVATQADWSLLVRKSETTVVPAAQRRHLGIVPYFPLASGLLTGKYRQGEDFPEGSRLAAMSFFAGLATDDNLAYVERLRAFAEERGHTVLELAIAWLLAHEGVASVIAGATTPEQVKTNAAAGSWRLSPEELAAVPQPGAN